MEYVLKISREDEELLDAINTDYHDGHCNFLESLDEINQYSKKDFNYLVWDRGDELITLFFLI